MTRNGTPRMSSPGDGQLQLAGYDVSCSHGRFVEPYIARGLRERTQTRFELHLFACEHCLRAVEFERFMKCSMNDSANSDGNCRSWH